MERWGHLEALLEDAALALDAHNLGALDEAVELLLLLILLRSMDSKI